LEHVCWQQARGTGKLVLLPLLAAVADFCPGAAGCVFLPLQDQKARINDGIVFLF
jgi:hypothetical protein